MLYLVSSCYTTCFAQNRVLTAKYNPSELARRYMEEAQMTFGECYGPRPHRKARFNRLKSFSKFPASSKPVRKAKMLEQLYQSNVISVMSRISVSVIAPAISTRGSVSDISMSARPFGTIGSCIPGVAGVNSMF